MPDPVASVVITTYNEAEGIRRTLASLGKQTDAPPFEIVLVDDRSSDDTVAIAEASGLKELRILHNSPNPGSSLTTRQQALDYGFRSARSGILLTLDGDSGVPPGWLIGMVRPILDGKANAVAGPITFVPDETAVARWQVADAAYYWTVSGLLSPFGGGGAFFGNFAFKKALYIEAGGFEAIGGALTEDLAFSLAIQRGGERILFSRGSGPAEVAPCPSLSALIERTIRISQGPPSRLAAVLTVWPLTLLVTAILAPFGDAFAVMFLLRYLVGAAFVRFAIERSGAIARGLNWLTYEPLAILLAFRVLPRALRGGNSHWGGQSYER